MVATYLTCVYIFRELYQVFYGEPRMPAEKYAHSHEAPPVMTGPMAVLAIGAAVLGFILAPWFVGEGWQAFWRDSIQIARVEPRSRGDGKPARLGGLASPRGDAGRHGHSVRLLRAGAGHPGVARHHVPADLSAVLLNKWYFDDLYRFLFVRPYFWLAHQLWQVGDVRIIDGLGPDGVSARVVDATRNVVRVQTGYVYHYAFAMLIGAAAMTTWFLFGGVR